MMVAVKSKILKWARETAGLELEEAAQKIYSDSKKASATDKLRALEDGDRELTQKQLFKLAKAYHQPLIVFYLSQPPREDVYAEDFRTAPAQGFDRKHEANLRLLMRNIKASQSIVSNLLEDEGATACDLIGSASMGMGAEAVARSITDRIGFNLKEFRGKGNSRGAFDYLRERIESVGVFVQLASDLGSHHTTIPVEVFRGFTLADPIAPYIIINRQDAKSAWNFTALHECAHLWLGHSGVSGAFSEVAIERFCDEVAAEILLPADELESLRFPRDLDLDGHAERISSFADERKISGTMVAYNLHVAGIIPSERWRELRLKFYQMWLDSRQKEKKDRSGAGGPSYYAVRRFLLGPGLVGLAKYFVSGGELTPSKASVALGVNAAKVFRLLYPERAKR